MRSKISLSESIPKASEETDTDQRSLTRGFDAVAIGFEITAPRLSNPAALRSCGTANAQTLGTELVQPHKLDEYLFRY